MYSSKTSLHFIPSYSHSTKHGSNQLTLTILFHLWHLLVIQSCTLLVSLVKMVVLLSFFDHSWNSNFSALATYLHLNLSNLWLLNFQLAIRKPSFLTSIALHLSKCLPFLMNSRIYSKFLFHHHLSSSSVVTEFNIHADSDLTTPNKFSGILDNFHLTQHINFPTHDYGHTLDLLITRSSSTVITHLSHHESYQSDHKSFTFKFFPNIRPTTQRSTIQYRSYNTIDVDNFKSDILTSPLYTNPASNASDLADQFSSTLKSILDIHAPIRSKTVVQRLHTLWINPEILQAKRERSRLERCWRRWKSPFDRMKFRAQCNCQIPHFQSQVLIFVQSCNWIFCQSSHTLENPQHNSSSKSFKLTSRVPRCIIPCQHIPWYFQRQNWTHPHQIFTIWFSWSVSFSTCPTFKADQFYSSHSHWNSQTHFCFWK